MPTQSPEPLVLENRHTGERIALRPVMRDGELCLEIKGTVPPYGDGPPLHIHFAEDEEGQVMSGTLSAILNGERLRAKAGESGKFPRGSAHRWWNGDGETLVFDGYARPLVDLDRYLQAIFEVLNASPKGRPDPFYMAHVALRHWRTQAFLLMPRAGPSSLVSCARAGRNRSGPVSWGGLARMSHALSGGPTMTKAAKVMQMLIRAFGVVQIVIGFAIWMGYGLHPPVIHMAIGVVFVLALWILAILGARARVGAPLVALVLVWGALTAVFGMAQSAILPGPHHWIIRVLHLLVGVAAMGQAEALAGRMKRAVSHSAATEATRALS